jgi:tRNA(Arg) A34 adenosine deaminase TadA
MDDGQQHQVVALLIRGGNVARHGVNRLRYSRGLSYFNSSLHAEVDLIRNCDPSELIGSKVYVYRFNNTIHPQAREPKVSAPCPLCQHMLKSAQIGRVAFIDRDNQLVSRKGRDLHSLVDHPYNITTTFATRQKDNAEMRFNAVNYIEEMQ